MKLAPKVLILGGHCKVALLLTRRLLARGWDVMSLTYSPEHRSQILDLQQKPEGGGETEGKVGVLVANLEHIDTDCAARSLLERVNPNYVVWMAGTGCRGTSQRFSDSEELKLAAKQMITASLTSSKVSKFLMISYLSNRRKKRDLQARDENWQTIANANAENLPVHMKTCGLEAEEVLDAMVVWRERQTHLPQGFQAIQVTTSCLSDAPATGTVYLHSGQTENEVEVSREDVAEVIERLLLRADTTGRFCILRGEESIESAIEQAVRSRKSEDGCR